MFHLLFLSQTHTHTPSIINLRVQIENETSYDEIERKLIHQLEPPGSTPFQYPLESSGSSTGFGSSNVNPVRAWSWTTPNPLFSISCIINPDEKTEFESKTGLACVLIFTEVPLPELKLAVVVVGVVVLRRSTNERWWVELKLGFCWGQKGKLTSWGIPL